MSAEVFGKPDAGRIVYEASFGAAQILEATGEKSGMAFTLGERGGKYAAELLMAALSELGIEVPYEERGEEIRAAITVIADSSSNPKHVKFYKEAQEAGLTGADFEALAGANFNG